MSQLAYVLLNVQPGNLENVQIGLKKIDGIREIHAVYGVYDLIIKIEFETMDELKSRILNNRLINEGIKNSMTMICVA